MSKFKKLFYNYISFLRYVLMNKAFIVVSLSFMSSSHGALSSTKIRCENIFSQINSSKEESTQGGHKKDLAKSWAESVIAIKKINEIAYSRSQEIEAILSAVLAKEFVWMNGEPGGAKTFLARLIFQSVLNSISEQDKRIFILQFHQLLAPGKIQGFAKFNKIMQNGVHEIETSTSLIGDKYLFLIADEAEKASPETLNSLLSLLQERKAFWGSRVIDSILSSGIFTSNKTRDQFISSYLADQSSAMALLDRLGISIHIINQQLSSKETLAMHDLIKSPNKHSISLPILDLESLISKVTISDEIMFRISKMIYLTDQFVTEKSDRTREQVRYNELTNGYFPYNQFSIRSDIRIIKLFKSSFIVHQLAQGVPYDKIRFNVNVADLSLLAKSSLAIGPAFMQLKTFQVSETDDKSVILHGVRVISDLGLQVTLKAVYSPYDGKLFLQDRKGNTQIILKLESQNDKTDWTVSYKTSEFAKYEIDRSSLDQLNNKLNDILEANQVNIDRPQFEVNSRVIDAIIGNGIIEKKTAVELGHIKEDLVEFTKNMNDQIKEGNSHFQTSGKKLLPPRTRKEVREFVREVKNLSGNERVARFYDWISYEIRILSQKFKESEHSIEAHLTSLMSGSHLYVFGLPGGAKTALADVIIKAELKNINALEIQKFVKSIVESKGVENSFLRSVVKKMREENPELHDYFLLQFNKLTPEGLLTGFPKIEKQLNEGIEEIETKTSLANKKFLFAILDEVDKANPQTLTALLGILNERQVFHGHTVFKTALRTAILTSNKMPSEFLESFGLRDRDNGVAFLNRVLNKAYISNKFSSVEALAEFLINFEKGNNTKYNGLLGISELVPLTEGVKFENEAIREIFAEVRTQFLKKRDKISKDSYDDFVNNPKANPNYYLTAVGSFSDRSFNEIFLQFKYRFIVHQLMQGVPFKDLRFTITIQDLKLFFEGLGYWAPQKIISSSNADGSILFTADSHTIDQLLESKIVDSRTQYMLQMMKDEAVDFARIATSVSNEFLSGYRGEIVQYSQIFSGPIESKLPAEVKKSILLYFKELGKLKIKLETAKANGETSFVITALEGDYAKNEKSIIDYLITYKIMTREAFFTKLKAVIIKLQSEQLGVDTRKNVERTSRKKILEVENGPIGSAQKIIFNEISSGKVLTDSSERKMVAKRPSSFSIMSTKLTQLMWARLQIALGEKDLNVINPSHEVPEEEPSKIQIDDIEVYLNPDHPVTNVSRNGDVQLLLEKLNRMSISGDEKDQLKLKQIIPGHQKGDIYDLPSAAQREQVMSSFLPITDESSLMNVAWYSKNSEGRNHPVAKKDPRRNSSNQFFFDFEGNGWEMTSSNSDGQKSLNGSVGLLENSGPFMIVYGGSAMTSLAAHEPRKQNIRDPNEKSANLTLRLVRVRK